MNKPLRLWIQFVATLGALVIVQSLRLASGDAAPVRVAAFSRRWRSHGLVLDEDRVGVRERHHRRHVLHHYRAAVRAGAGDACDCAGHVASPRGAAATTVRAWRSTRRRPRSACGREATCSSCSRVFPRCTHAQAPAGQLIAPLLALTAVYFLINSGLIAVAIGLDARPLAH